MEKRRKKNGYPDILTNERFPSLEKTSTRGAKIGVICFPPVPCVCFSTRWAVSRVRSKSPEARRTYLVPLQGLLNNKATGARTRLSRHTGAGTQLVFGRSGPGSLQAEEHTSLSQGIQQVPTDSQPSRSTQARGTGARPAIRAFSGQHKGRQP